MNKFTSFVSALVNMKDEVDYAAAGLSIRKNISFRGPNVIILACAILIASVGLNVNSIPVIIGAMLISPVMGPILGFGFGLATKDMGLVKDGLRNLLVMVSISIIASAIYFLLSPLKLQHPTELLSRTNPTIYDVLIALFGGIAGVIEISRKEKGTVLSGVAIATALMPPLCTIGYGLSVWNWGHVLGAFYLFIINSIFISLAAFLVARYLHYPEVREEGEPAGKSLIRSRTITFLVILTVVPSVISAVNIIKESNFQTHISRLVEEHKTLGGSFIYDYNVDFKSKPASAELFIAGDKMDEGERERLFSDAAKLGIDRSQIIFREDATVSREAMSESELIKGIYERSDIQIKRLADSVNVLNRELSQYRLKELPSIAVARELSAQYPQVKGLILTGGSAVDSTANFSGERVVAILNTSAPLDGTALGRIRNWLGIRLGRENVIVMQKTF